MLIGVGGEEEFLSYLRDGRLKNAVRDLTDTGIKIAVETKSIPVATKWEKVAGKDLKRILDLGIHLTNSPDSYDDSKIQKLFSLNNDVFIKKISSLNTRQRDILFGLSQEDFKDLVRNLPSDHLSSLSIYIDNLRSDQAKRFLRDIKSSPEKMNLFSRSHVRNGILQSRDQGAALDLMLRSRSALEILHLPEDIKLVADGQISLILLWTKQTLGVIAAGILLLISVLLLYRLILGRRPKVIVTNADK